MPDPFPGVAEEGPHGPDDAQPDDGRGDEQRLQHRSHLQARRHDVGRGGGTGASGGGDSA